MRRTNHHRKGLSNVSRLALVGIAWTVSLLVTACVLPHTFGSWSETMTMMAAAFLMLVFGPYLLVVGLCDGWVGDIGWGLVAGAPFFVAQVAFLWVLSSKTSLWRRMGRFGQLARRIAVAALAVLSAVGIWCEIPRIESHRVTVAGGMIKEAPLRLAVLSDLHSCHYGEGQRSLLDAVRRERPDAVLLVGDIADDRLDDANAMIVVRQLAKEYPCFYVSGNHEYWSERVDEIKAWIRDSGAVVLEGDVYTMELKGTMVDFCGVDDPTYIRDTWNEQLKAAHAKSNSGHLRILLSHRPERADVYAQYDFDIIVSGHLHGGQVRLPGCDVGLYGPIRGYRRFFPRYTDGVYAISEKTRLIVSRGLARESTPLPRFFNHPEIMMVEIVSESQTDAPRTAPPEVSNSHFEGEGCAESSLSDETPTLAPLREGGCPTGAGGSIPCITLAAAHPSLGVLPPALCATPLSEGGACVVLSSCSGYPARPFPESQNENCWPEVSTLDMGPLA